MQQNGMLVCTTPNSLIYQGENLVDNFHLLLPKTYKEIDLETYTIALKYVSSENTSKYEILTLHNNAYKNDYLEYVLPITTELTKASGEVRLYITMSKFDTVSKRKYISQSSETTIRILPVENYFTDDSSFQSIDNKIFELKQLAEKINTTKADNIVREDNDVYLTANGKKIGDSVSVEACDPEGIDIIEFGETSGGDTESGYDVIEF